jgi:hypothetical protein
LDPSPERCGIFLISVLQSAIKAVTRLLRPFLTRSLKQRSSKFCGLEVRTPELSEVPPDRGYSTSPLFIAASSRYYLASVWFQAQATTGLCFIESTRSRLANLGQPGDESETPVGSQKPQMPFRESIVHFNSITCTSFDAIISDH